MLHNRLLIIPKFLKNIRKMTQSVANKIFESRLGQQLDIIYVTSDDCPFIRHSDATSHAERLKTLNGSVDTTITEFYRDFVELE